MIILLKGGTSAEREVSLWTASAMREALVSLNLDFKEVDAADGDWLEQIVRSKPDVVLIALHGPFGEDGTVQKALEQKGIPFTGSSSAVSHIAIDKAKTKEMVAKLGISIPISYTFRKNEKVFWEGDYPVVVKPNRDGSSYGITVVDEGNKLEEAAHFAFSFGSEIIIEEYIGGTELSCGVFALNGNERVLPVIEICPAGEFFDFDAKYTESGCLEICPARIDEKMSMLIQECSLQIFSALSCRHYARIDWILRGDTPYFLEINTLPGMTKMSLFPKELVAEGIEYQTFISDLIACV